MKRGEKFIVVGNRMIIEAIDQLVSLIDQYKIDNVVPQVERLQYLKEYLKTKEVMTVRNKLSLYQELFPPQGGLSDIYYWDNDFENRKQINNILSSSNKIISEYLLNQ